LKLTGGGLIKKKFPQSGDDCELNDLFAIFAASREASCRYSKLGIED
jgi:hypothetical protein